MQDLGERLGAVEAFEFGTPLRFIEHLPGSPGSSITYFEDGTFSGTYDSFVKGQGGRTQLKGTWELTPLATNKGLLALKFNHGKQWQGTFKVINRNLTHNIEENYDSVRIPD